MSVNYSAAIGIGMMLGEKILSKDFMTTYSDYVHFLHYDDDTDIFIGEIASETDSYLDISNRTWFQNAEFRMFWEDLCAELNDSTLEPNLILMQRVD